ncbi:recombination regulator RecX [Clostridium sp.]|uniref:recombination regulator RecX n=1 Tax=Clostridium sp. TaxID=1506 RepID=UPI00260B9DA6|nr:recombination regulator RecX [Clostridium sp.]
MNKITKIEVQKRNKDRVNVFVDESFAFAISAEILYKEGLKVDEIIDVEKVEKVAKEDSFIKCKSSALRMVERSYKTQKEIGDKLFTKGYDKEVIERTMEFLKEYEFVNDEAYLNMYIKDKIKGQGQNKIKYDLMKKGIKDTEIHEAISNIDEDEELEAAKGLALKKYNVIKKSESDEYKISQKLYRFLITKGYNYDLVKKAIKEIKED